MFKLFVAVDSFIFCQWCLVYEIVIFSDGGASVDKETKSKDTPNQNFVPV
jgi:hypothetical protein